MKDKEGEESLQNTGLRPVTGEREGGGSSKKSFGAQHSSEKSRPALRRVPKEVTHRRSPTSGRNGPALGPVVVHQQAWPRPEPGWIKVQQLEAVNPLRSTRLAS